MQALAFISYGMGGAALDPAGGEATLVARLKAIGIDTADSPYQWSDLQTIIAAIIAAPADAKVIVGGDSLGANEAPAIAAALIHVRKIDYLFGFQRSAWGEQVAVPANVIEARSIYDPGVIGAILTAGMGSDPWTLAPGNTATKLRNVAIEAAHPDDYGAAQDIVFADIKRIIGA